jgi:hypothetical protein
MGNTASGSATSEDGRKLYCAAIRGDDKEVERLLKMGVKPDDWKHPEVRRFFPLR